MKRDIQICYNEMEEYRNKFCKTYENIQDELDELNDTVELIYQDVINA